MTFVIAGASGKSGRVAADILLAEGERVRVIVRDPAKGAAWKARGAEVAVADLRRSADVAVALRGAAGAYLLVPPSFTAPDFRAYQSAVARSLAAGITESGVPHVVFLSSVGAHQEGGTGPIAALHDAEASLRAIAGTAVTTIRAGYFLENLEAVLGAVRGAFVLPSFLPGSLSVPMVATTDIGRIAAELLIQRPSESSIIELGTPHTYDEIAAALGALLGHEVRVAESPADAAAAAFAAIGAPPDLCALYTEMFAAMRSGRVAMEGTHRRVGAFEPIVESLRRMLEAQCKPT